ncbi:neutral amino acid transporter 9-like isoform X2 [Paramacrobiotus metropolitanus]|uniref:neutral amino acid transporter 9-like isoform X2 n=1 Tax=Paramacrobiotus metropolitanus TaxID=2943436 RepID=UPI002445FBF3|nr:neutral amino acid transporter 9-like isoform X2 [Paramacrobiotus metropolitanus]
MGTESQQAGSVTTVFSLWNAMMGTTMLAIPWAIQQAGFTLGIFLTLFIAGLSYYTITLVLSMADEMRFRQVDGSVPIQDFSEVCAYFVGRRFGQITVCISLFTMITAGIAYWILMSDFLFEMGHSIAGFLNTTSNGTKSHHLYMTHGPMYVKHFRATEDTPSATGGIFSQIWTQSFIPLFLVVAIFPLTLIRTPVIFTKISSLGVISVFYLIALVGVKAGILGLNFDFCADPTLRDFRSGFPALTGTMVMAFFLHNTVVAMTTASNPNTRSRDTGIAYILACITYLYIGITVYVTFPENKGTIQDNFLKNFASSDVLGLVARALLLLQMISIFPLLVYVTRIQLVRQLLRRDPQNFKWILITSVTLISAGTLMAIFFPKIGTVLRVTGSLAGLAFSFTLPCIVYLTYLRQEGKTTHAIVWTHLLIILLGLINFISQFLI